MYGIPTILRYISGIQKSIDRRKVPEKVRDVKLNV